jgi:hypothetical protein
MTPDELMAVLREPVHEARAGDRISAWFRFRDGWLRVVLVEEVDTMAIVTVIWPARPPREA